jgi:DNA-directed RNA polymerase specialized sigma24 family protein
VGWTHQAIAAQLGIQPGTSKSQLFRARRALRGLLQPTIQNQESDDVREA